MVDSSLIVFLSYSVFTHYFYYLCLRIIIYKRSHAAPLLSIKVSIYFLTMCASAEFLRQQLPYAGTVL